MATPAVEARRMFRLRAEHAPEINERQGESFRRFDQMSTDYAFWLTEELPAFSFSAHVHGLRSERMAVYVDDKRVGAAKLKEGETRVVTIQGQELALPPGRHKLTIALSRPKDGSPEAEISWVRLGKPQKEETVPATRRQTLTEAAIENRGLRSVVLQPNASLRCPVWVPKKSQLVTEFGIWGEGPAQAEIVVHTKTGGHIVVAEAEREEDDPRDFAPLTADLSQFGAQFVDIELRAARSLERTRVAFGEPRLRTESNKSEPQIRARRAIVIALSGLSDVHAPPTSAEHGLPFFNQLAEEATLFSSYRTSTTSVQGVMASLLTGLSPWEHGVEDEDDAISPSVATLAAAIESEGGRSSFFTGVPLSFAPFGFQRGFSKFESIGPQEDRSATEPLELAKKWLSAHLDHEGPVLSVVHLRGGHPPFDVPREAGSALAPKEYTGDLSPRRAAIQLGEIRWRSSARYRSMPEEDWVRLFALQKAALLKQSAALSDLLAWLRKLDAYDDTLLIVMGDGGAGSRPDIPFASKRPLSESALGAPLIIKFPAGHLRGESLDGPFAPQDISSTLLWALGLESNLAGINLANRSAREQALFRPHMAYRDGAYSMLLDGQLLIGQDGSAPRLCEPSLDPTCQMDRSDAHVLQARALWLSAYDILAPALAALEDSQENAPRKEDGDGDEGESDEDSFFENALTVWGVDP